MKCWLPSMTNSYHAPASTRSLGATIRDLFNNSAKSWWVMLTHEVELRSNSPEIYILRPARGPGEQAHQLGALNRS